MEEFNNENFKNGCSFIWKIYNYSYCVQGKDEYLTSPDFLLHSSRKCNLHLFPRGISNDSENVGFQLYAHDHLEADCDYALYYEVSVLTISGSFQKFGTRNITNMNKKRCKSPTNFLEGSHSKGGLKDFLDNDILTVAFRFRVTEKPDIILNNHRACCAHTVINVHRTIYHWKIDTVGYSSKMTLATNAEPNLFTVHNFTLDASLVKNECCDEEKLEVVIKRSNANTSFFSTCTISIVEDGKILHIKQNEHLFGELEGEHEQTWTISFTPNITLTKNEKQGCRKFLRFEFATSDGSCMLEKIEHGTTEEEVHCVVPKPSESFDSLTWRDNLQTFYYNGKLSDTKLRTPEKEFPAHKVMLCAQSKVFSAMFEHDTKENQTGIVEIEDLDNQTVSRMLHYIYSGVLETDRIDWEMSAKLYFAADKYAITALKEQCSLFLKVNLDVSNVCKCLVLADMHKDQNLKKIVQEFVLKHSSLVMKSEEWKELMKNDVNLAAETMYLFCLKNS